MFWNHRVVRRVYEHETVYGIHEVYYDKDTGKPINITLNPVGVYADSAKEISWVLDRMYNALSKPVLDYESLEEVADAIVKVENYQI